MQTATAEKQSYCQADIYYLCPPHNNTCIV